MTTVGTMRIIIRMTPVWSMWVVIWVASMGSMMIANLRLTLVTSVWTVWIVIRVTAM